MLAKVACGRTTRLRPRRGDLRVLAEEHWENAELALVAEVALWLDTLDAALVPSGDPKPGVRIPAGT